MADDSKNGSEKDRNAPTVRDLAPRAVSSDTVPDVIGQYVPPRPLPGVSDHRTLDLKSVHLSPQFDPRRALTERRIVMPAYEEPKPSKRWLVAGLLVLFAIGAWLVVLGLASSNEVTSVPTASPAAAVPPVAAPPPRATPSAAPAPASPTQAASSASELAAPKETETRVEPPAASALPKPAAREPEKKRREPWLQ